MKVPVRLVLVVLSCLWTLATQASVAPPAADAAKPLDAKSKASVRAELSSYFKDIEKNSPTVLGGLAQSPDTMAAIQKRIDGLSDAELTRFRDLMAEAPDWKVAPEAIASAFPPEMLNQINRVGAEYTAQVPKGDRMRDDVRTLVGVLKQLPDEKLQQAGIDRQMVASLEATFTEMSAMQAAMLQKHAGATSSWREQSALAISALPPALQRGAAALADHGPLTSEDVAALNKFRAELIHVLERVEKLPPAMKDNLNLQGLSGQVRQLWAAPPDVLFMMRHNLTPEMMTSLHGNVAFLERISKFTVEERAQLETFRNELTDVFKGVKPDGAASDWAGAQDLTAGLAPEHLFLLQQRMNTFGDWQVALPVMYQTLLSPELPARLRAVRGETADPAAVEAVEAFRFQAIAYIDAEGAASGLDSSQVARARQVIGTVPTDQLELIRMATANLGPDASPRRRLSVVLAHEINFNCSVGFQVAPRICIPGGCVRICDPTGIFGGCTDICTPEICTPAVNVTLNFDLFCNPVEDVVETIEHGIVSIGNTLVETMRSGIDAAINAVKNTVNQSITAVTNVVDSVINAIVGTVNDIWDFLQSLPDKAWEAIQLALNALLDIEIKDGVTVRDLVGRGVKVALESMRTLLGLAGNWWTAISNFTLPAIPCPPTGFHTPFGNVGESAAVDNYGRYKLLIDGIVEMIPDTEVSLAIKIPAQVIYMAFDFLGLCLEQAAANADQAELTSRHNIVLENFANMQMFVGTQLAGVALTSAGQTTQIMNLINTQSSNIQSTVSAQAQIIRAALSGKSTEIQNLVNQRSTEIQNLLQGENDATQADIKAFQTLYLRLVIEEVLQNGANGEITHLQLLEPWGFLSVVADVVQKSIDAMSQAQEGVGTSQRSLDSGKQLMTEGKHKEAFREFSKAYRELTKGPGQ
jgi:hypothetical protein